MDVRLKSWVVEANMDSSTLSSSQPEDNFTGEAQAYECFCGGLIVTLPYSAGDDGVACRWHCLACHLEFGRAWRVGIGHQTNPVRLRGLRHVNLLAAGSGVLCLTRRLCCKPSLAARVCVIVASRFFYPGQAISALVRRR